MKPEKPQPILLKNYTPPPYLIDTVDLDVVLHPTSTRVRATLSLRPNPAARKAGGPLVLDGELLELGAIALDGKALDPADYKVSPHALTIPRVPDKPFKLDIETFCDPEANTALSGLYRSRQIYCTQCEAEGFRRITYYLDRPDVLATYTTRIEADRETAPVLLSNGNLIKEGRLASGRHFAIWHDPHPKPAYLFALVGGKLAAHKDTFKTMSGRKVDLAIYVEPGKEDRCAWAMDALKRSMTWDEERFGREYDLDVFNIVAVSDFNMGAMENKGLNIFNDRLVLAKPETTTDGAYADIERVIAHEYFHNWTGNRITCRDWFQLCLKEGLTVYRDQEFSADTRSRTVQRIHDVRQLKARQFPEDAGPLAHPVRPASYIEINNFYTATVYEKGAELVRMIATMLGRETFRRGMDLYFERHDGEAATVEQFLQCFADVSGRNLDQFMNWYNQPGTPELVASLKYDARAKTATLEVEQVHGPSPGAPKKKPVPLPLKIGLIGANGQELPLKLANGRDAPDGVLEMSKRVERWTFRDVPSKPTASLLREFSAPVNLTVSHNERQLEFLMTHDSDGFNRWQATQDYAMRLLIGAVKTLRKGERPTRPSAYCGALAAVLADKSLEAAYVAQVLAVPSESDIARVLARDVDPALIHRARRWLRKAIGSELGEHLAAIYEASDGARRYSPDAKSAGARALRLGALGLLAARGQSADIARVTRHFKDARNATDEIGALAILSALNVPERVEAFDRFYQRWKGDHLVIASWFGLQATSPLSSTLRTVKQLMTHAQFSMRTPNNVYALIGSFAGGNPLQFNRPDGKGYAFVADRVVELDKINPQVAARILGAFRSWRALESARKRLALRALEKIASTPELSNDAREIVTKMLD
ncbi:MAG: aminopeptidase N [Hyphomicrobium sp.]|nr:aminopeptidase N [Hyphomicrobium sp.]